MKSVVIAALAASAVTGATVLHWPRSAQPPPLVTSEHLASAGNDTLDLRKVIDQQQAQIEELRSTIARLEHRAYSEAPSVDEASLPTPVTSRAARSSIRTPDKENLLDAGLSEAQAATVSTLVSGDADAEQSPENLRNEIVSQLGEGAYDGYLYATGQSNRLIVSSTTNSETGIESGDRLHSLDGQRIYSTNDLKAGIASDQAADWLSLTVERNGEPVMLYIPRDNIGFRVERLRVNPVEPAG